MILFYLLLLVIAAIPVAMVLPALVRKKSRQTVNSDQLNIEIAKSRIDEVRQHLENNRDRTIAEQELQATLLDDLQDQGDPDKKSTTVPAAWNILLLLAVPLASIAIYAWIGNPQFAVNENLLKAGNQHPVENPDIHTLLDQLEQKIAQDPENPKGWELAATTYMSIGNYAKAEHAYAQLNQIIIGNPDLLTAWADASIMNSGGYTPKTRKSIENALSIDPFHVNALWIAGLGAQNLGNHAEALNYFNRLKPLLGDNQDSIDRVNELMKVSDTQNANTGQSASTSATRESGRSIAVTLDIEPDIRQRIDDEAVVFIIAKAKSGPSAPLAVSRHTVAELPLETTLTESMAMISELTIASFDEISITARVSLSGNALQQKGDFISDDVTVSKDDHDRSVKLVIEKEITE